MTPYYQDDLVTIYHGDCREVLSALPADSCDLVFADPPYGIGKAEWDAELPLWWLDDAARIAPNLAITPGVWNLLGLPRVIGRLQYRWTLAAHLSNGMTRGAIGPANWIPCAYWTVGNDAESAWCFDFWDWCQRNRVSFAALNAATGTTDMGRWWASRLAHRSQIPTPTEWSKLRAAFPDIPGHFDFMVRATASQNAGDSKTFVVGNVSKPDHPSPKPLNVTSWFIGRLPGESVLDPFMGSGTTLVASKSLGRKSVGIEIEERYCEIAANRCRQEVLGLSA